MCGNEFQWLDACANVTSMQICKLSELFTQGKLSQAKKNYMLHYYPHPIIPPPPQEPNEAELTLSPID